MPALDPDLIAAPGSQPISVALEPAQNSLYSLILLCKADALSGLDEWVTRAAAALSSEQRYHNRLVSIGLHYAVVPDRSWSSFSAYIDHLAAQDPAILRDRIFNAYAQIRKKDAECCPIPDPASSRVSVDTAALLESVDAFLAFLMERFPAENIDLELESEAHRYLKDPPAMQSLIVSHFRRMWEEVLSSEWNRILPRLKVSRDALQGLNLGGLSKLVAAQRILGKDLEDRCWEEELERAERLIFVPSGHLGPYLGKFKFGSTLWLLLGARIPEGAQIDAPDLSRGEMLIRIGALADDTRLRILKLISEEGELCSSDIMSRLELSQSAASRHLQQLSAAGYLRERRRNGAKCYVLNENRVEDMLRAISSFLLGK